MKNQIQCSKCFNYVHQILPMDCSHDLCLNCANRLLLKLQKNKNPRDNSTLIICQICNSTSHINPQSYKQLINASINNTHLQWQDLHKINLSQRVTQQRRVNHKSNNYLETDNRQQTSLFCFSCMTTCFSIDQYLNGLHQNHNVKNILKSYDSLKSLLEEINEKVKNKIEIGLKESNRLTQKKRDLIEFLGTSKSNIKIEFQKMRQIINQKEDQLLEKFESHMSHRFTILDKNLQDLKIFIEKCENHSVQLTHYEELENLHYNQLVNAFNFYSENKNTIRKQISYQIEGISQKVIGSMSQLVIGYESILNSVETLKKMDLKLKQQQDQEQNYFEVKRRQIFQNTNIAVEKKKTLSRMKSADNLSQNLQESVIRQRDTIPYNLNQRIKGLEHLINNRKTFDNIKRNSRLKMF